jgi:hypothetical protein
VQRQQVPALYPTCSLGEGRFRCLEAGDIINSGSSRTWDALSTQLVEAVLIFTNLKASTEASRLHLVCVLGEVRLQHRFQGYVHHRAVCMLFAVVVSRVKSQGDEITSVQGRDHKCAMINPNLTRTIMQSENLVVR